MAKVDKNGNLIGTVGGWTYYVRNGESIVRQAHSHHMKRLTRAQFIQRQRFTHNKLLWNVLKQTKAQVGEVFFEGGASAFNRFMSVNRGVPDVYPPKSRCSSPNALLLPGMSLSDGPLPAFDYQLGEHNGQPALLTDLSEAVAAEGRLLLYVLRQDVGSFSHTIQAKVTELGPVADGVTVVIANGREVTVVVSDGRLVLTGSLFADEMAGFGLVHVVDGHVSPQHLVTRCTYYQQYTTDEALLDAAWSFGKVRDYGDNWCCYTK